MPNSLTEIGGSAFCDCESLSNITIPNSITVIETQTFDGCKSLKTVVLPNKLVKICKFAFFNCKTLDNVILPDTLTTIEDDVFYGCSSLSELFIPKNITKLGYFFVSPYNNVNLKFEDTNGWQKRYTDSSSLNSTGYYGDWEDIDSSIMADSDALKKLMKSEYNDGKITYKYEFQKV